MKTALIFLLIVTHCFAQFSGNGVNLFTATANATVGNSTAEGSLVGAGVGSMVFPAGSMYQGRTYSLIAYGYYSTALLSIGTFTLRIKLNGTTILSTTASSLSLNTANQTFQVRANFTCRSPGTPGSLMAQGDLRYLTGLNANVMDGMVNTAATALDTTVAQSLDMTAQWGTLNANNTVTVTNLFLQGWN